MAGHGAHAGREAILRGRVREVGKTSRDGAAFATRHQAASRVAGAQPLLPSFREQPSSPLVIGHLALRIVHWAWARVMNRQIADRLEEAARLLRDQGADPYRVNAYLRAAESVRRWPEPLKDLYLREGVEGLERVPGVGASIARAIRAIVIYGRLPMTDRLRGELDPVTVLATVPGIGRRFADRLHEQLGLSTLEDLEAAAHDGRLATIAGFGEKRLAGIRDSLAQRLGRVRPAARPAARVPPVAELLDVDREYRQRAAGGELPLIAPRRFNPAHEAWLPVLHTRRGSRHYTALFSNTARAHRAGKTHDWVVLYGEDHGRDYQYTVITAARGPLAGRRIVAGRESECEAATATAA